MNTFCLKISSPDGNLFNGQALQLSLRGSEGDLAILAGHIPFTTAVVPGECRIELEDGSVRVGHTDGGILTVSADAVTMLSGSFHWQNA